MAQLLPSPLAGHGSQDLASSPYLTDQEYPGSVRYDEPRSPIFGFLRQTPEVTNFFPQRGGEGTRLSVQLRSSYDLSSHSATFALSFESQRCECVPQLANVQDSVFHYVLIVDTPTFISTKSPSFAVPLRLVIDHHADQTPTVLRVGVYTYEQVGQPSFSDDPHQGGAVAPVNNVSPMHPHKRQPTQQIEVKGEHDHHPYHDDSPASYSPFLPPGTTAGGFSGLYASDNSPPALHFVGSSGISQPTLKAPAPLTPSWAGPMNGVSMAAAPHPQAVSSARPPNPTLIRTSTIPQSSNMGQALPFNPYAMYPTKAVLKLNGDLDSMTENWSPDERDAKRRLVQFTRVQTGSTIHADFKPVSPEDRAPNSICISCIHWEGKNECFVTSVDTIYLLESLVGVRFTVEEKNRIRRNLEGFRPLTVSKAKADSEEFFKVIMGFPAPKPRNIEKDVKVFPWKILGHALKKIIGKYVSLPFLHLLRLLGKGGKKANSFAPCSLRAILQLLEHSRLLSMQATAAMAHLRMQAPTLSMPRPLSRYLNLLRRAHTQPICQPPRSRHPWGPLNLHLVMVGRAPQSLVSILIIHMARCQRPTPISHRVQRASPFWQLGLGHSTILSMATFRLSRLPTQRTSTTLLRFPTP